MRCAVSAHSAVRQGGARPCVSARGAAPSKSSSRSSSSSSSSSAAPAGSGSSSIETLRLARQQLSDSLRAKRINRSEVERRAQLLEAAALQAAQAQLAEQNAQLAAAEASVVQAQLEKRVVEAEAETSLVKARVYIKALVMAILGIRGMQNALGLMGYAEGHLFPDPELGVLWDRKRKWSTLGSSHKQLQDCIVQATGWTAESIPDRAVELYNHLSALERSGSLPTAFTSSKVPLVEGPLSREQMLFLECVANEVLCPVELHYLTQPAASTE